MSKNIGNGEAVSTSSLVDQLTSTPIKPKHFPDAEPLIRQKSEGKPIDLTKLGPISEPIQAIAHITQAPVEIAMQSVLATTALAAQHSGDVETLAGRAPISLFLITVAASGERKSSTDKLAIRALQNWEEEQGPIHRNAMAEHDFAMSVFDKMKRDAVKDQAGDVIDAKAPQAPMPPIAPIKVISDFTFEGLLSHYETGNPSIAIFSDEGGQIFGGHAMSKENLLKTSAGMSKLWDPAPVNRTRAGTAQMTFRHRRASMHVMIQPRIADTVLGNPELLDQGFLSRTLVAWPKSQIGLRLIDLSPEATEARDLAFAKIDRFNARIARMLAIAPNTKGDPREIYPRLLRLSDGARVRLVDFANRVELDQAQGGPYAEITGFASKAAEQAVRIAGVLALFADTDAQEVSDATMQSALVLAQWYLDEAARLFDMGYVNPEMKEAQILLDWLQAKCGHDHFTKRHIVRNGPKSIRDTNKVTRLLEILDKHKHVKPVMFFGNVDGQSVKEAWELTYVA